MSIATPPRPVYPRGSGPQPQVMKPAGMAASIDPIRVLRRHIIGIIMSIIVGGVLGVASFFAFLYVYPLYSGQVVFEVSPGLMEAAKIGNIDTTNDETVYRLAQTESFLLVSREILDLAMKNPEILKTEWHKQFVKKSSDGNESFDNFEAVDELREEVHASPIRSSNLFTLTWSSTNKDDVPVILNAISTAYLQERERRDREVYNKNLMVFRGQSDETERQLQDIAQQMKSLIRVVGLTDLESVYQSAQGFRMQELTRQLAEVSSALSVSQSNLQLVTEQIRGNIEPTSMDVYEAERDHSVMNLIETIQYMHVELRRLLAARDASDPLVLNQQERIRAAEAQRDAKVQDIIRRNLEARAKQYANDVERFGATATKLEDELEEIRALMKDLAAELSQYEALKTRREHLEVKRTADIQLINEVELMRARADAARVRLAQRALTPRELSFPKPEIMVPLGVLLVLGLTVGIIFLREMMDQRVKSASDLAVLPGAHVLGSIPDLSDDPTKTPAAELVVRKYPMSVLAESYRQAAASLFPMLDRNAHQTLLLMGGLPGSGTTTVATNLAGAAAAAGRRVAVIDANFRRPRLAQAMGIAKEGPGLADVLVNAATIDQAMTMTDGIAVMPAGTPANRVFDRLNNGSFDSLLAELRTRFDLVIFDAPPAVVSGDAMILANKVDAAVMVVRAHQEHRGLVARMIQRLAGARCELLGVLLNRPLGLAGGYLKKNYATMAEYSSAA